jgi:hypothetical protein
LTVVGSSVVEDFVFLWKYGVKVLIKLVDMVVDERKEKKKK